MKEVVTQQDRIIDIDKKRASRFSVFDSMAEEKEWIERVKNECLEEHLKEEGEL